MMSSQRGIDATSALLALDTRAETGDRERKRLRMAMVAHVAAGDSDANSSVVVDGGGGGGGSAGPSASDDDWFTNEYVGLLEQARCDVLGVSSSSWNDGQLETLRLLLSPSCSSTRGAVGVFGGRTGVGKTLICYLPALLGVGRCEKAREEKQCIVLAFSWLRVVMNQMAADANDAVRKSSALSGVLDGGFAWVRACSHCILHQPLFSMIVTSHYSPW
jgi:hypothetical protein